VTVNSVEPNADLNPNGARRAIELARLCGYPRMMRITFSRFNVDSVRADAIGNARFSRERASAIRGAIELQLAVARPPLTRRCRSIPRDYVGAIALDEPR